MSFKEKIMGGEIVNF